MKKILDTLIALIESLINGFDDMCELALNIITLNFMTANPTDASGNAIQGGNAIHTVYDLAANGAESIAGVLSLVATSICGLCFLIEFIKVSMKMDMLKWETAVTALAKFAVAKASLDIAPQFLLAIYFKGAGAIADVKALAKFTTATSGASGNFGTSVTDALSAALSGQSWQAVVPVLGLLIIFVAVWVIGIMIVVMAYGRIFEIILYAAVCPIPASFLVLEQSQITKKFFLNFAAVVIQGLIMIIILAIFKTFALALLDGLDLTARGFKPMMSIMTQTLLAALLLITMMMKSSSLSKAILGQA